MADGPDSASSTGGESNAEPDGAPPAHVGDVADARLDLRSVGYCVLCDALVERAADGACPAGHPREAISGSLLLLDDETVPKLPRFNLAAFLIPFLWGPAHGQWVGVIFIPIWLFMDSIVQSAVHGSAITRVAAVIVVALTLGFEYFFARRANGVAYRLVINRTTVEEYVRRQRVWAIASVPIAVALVGWAVWFDAVIGPTLTR